MSLQDIQAQISNTPVDGVCDFNGEEVIIPNHSEVVIPHGMVIRGLNLNVDGDEVPDKSLMNADLIDKTSRLEFRGCKIDGPYCGEWDSMTENNKAAISWAYYKTWDGTLIIDDCEITGGYGTGVLRSGGGFFEVKNSQLSGFVDAIAFFEGHGGWGDLILRDTTMHAPDNTKYSSIGMYIHPHLHLNAERVTGSGWNRYLIYLNGSPQSAGHHTLTDVVAQDCSLIQTGSSSETTLIRCQELGDPSNGGSYLKGPVLSVGSLWTGTGMVGMLNRGPADRTFIRDTFQKSGGYHFAAGSGVSGTINLIDCDFQLQDKGRVMTLTQFSDVVATITSSKFSGSCTGFAFNIEGGELNVINTDLPANVRSAVNGTINYL